MNDSLDHNSRSADTIDCRSFRSGPDRRRFLPFSTVRCDGRPTFRTQLARDLGVLLDLDDEIAAWRCLPAAVEFHDSDGEILSHAPDFLVLNEDGSTILMDAEGPIGIRPCDPTTAYRSISTSEIRTEPALTNAREMMRYARRTVSLGDRVRLLAWLEEAGSVTLIEAASAMRESGEPVGAVLAMVLKRHVAIEWHEMPIGPETQVRLRR